MVLGDVEELLMGSCDKGLVGGVLSRAVVHILMNGDQQLFDIFGQFAERHERLFTGVAAHNDALVFLDILGTDLNADRYAAHFVLGKLPAGGMVGIVEFDAELGCKLLFEFVSLFEHAGLVMGDRDDHYLDGRDLRRQYQAVVVAVYHDQRADHTGGSAP